jgi:antitoxin (DNA-binding transcriptional repressor) of toxin-antitoxin stability system
MRRYSVAEARRRIAEVLDEAEKGHPVVIERKGVTFRVKREPAPPRRVARRTSQIEILDPAIEAGAWTWAPNERGELEFVPRSGKGRSSR